MENWDTCDEIEFPLESLIGRQKSFCKVERYKTDFCKNWVKNGYCEYGLKCRFAHGVSDLQNQRLSKLYKTK